MYEEYKLYGPYKSKKDGRLRCVLTKDKCNIKITISYPKYIYETHYNELIPDGYEIHHKDENPLNNNIDNLECIEKKTHVKNHSTKYKYDKIYKCEVCKEEFTLTPKQQSSFNRNSKRKARISIGPFCSKKCTGIYGSSIQNGIMAKW